MAKKKTKKTRRRRRIQKGGNSPLYRRQAPQQYQPSYQYPKYRPQNTPQNSQYNNYDKLLKRYEKIIEAKKNILGK